MTERKEPTISPITPDKDEIDQHRREPIEGKPRQKISVTKPVVVKSPLAPFALLLAFIGLAGSGYLFWLFTEAQKQFQTSLLAAEARVTELEGQLELSGDKSIASNAAIQAKLKWADSEIRKLWGVSYDKNRKTLKSQKTDINALKQQFSNVDTKINSAMKGPKAELKLLDDLISAQQSALSNIEKMAQTSQADTEKLTSQVNQLVKQHSDTRRRARANEQAVEAIDAFRRSVNRDLLQLKNANKNAQSP